LAAAVSPIRPAFANTFFVIRFLACLS